MTSTASGWDAIKKRLDAMPRPTGILRLCADADVRDRYLAAKQKAARASDYQTSLPKDVDKDARTLIDKDTQAALDDLAAAQQDYDACTITLTFQALEREQLEALRAQHPATEEDEELGRDFNFDTFAPALIAAASMDGMPLEDAVTAMKSWSLSDAQDLWNAAWGVQQRKRTDLGKD